MISKILLLALILFFYYWEATPGHSVTSCHPLLKQPNSLAHFPHTITYRNKSKELQETGIEMYNSKIIGKSWWTIRPIIVCPISYGIYWQILTVIICTVPFKSKRKGMSGLLIWVVFMMVKLAKGEEEIIKLYGEEYDDRINSVVTIPDVGYYAVGNTRNNAPGNSWVYTWMIKLNPVGEQLWSKMWEEVGNNYANAAALTKEGGCVIAGYAATTDIFAYVLKLDEDGGYVWEKFINTTYSRAQGVTSLVDENYAVVGFTTDVPSKGFIAKIRESDGEVLWETALDSATAFQGVVGLENGDVAVIGHYGGRTCTYALFSSNGTKLTEIDQIRFGDTDSSRCDAIAKAKGDNLVVAGRVSIAPLGDQALLIKLTVDGNIVWIKSIGPTGHDYVRSVIELPSGNYLFSGTTSWRAGTSDLWIFITTTDGVLTSWDKKYGAVHRRYGQALCIGSDSAIVAAGFKGVNHNDFYIVITCMPGTYFAPSPSGDRACQPCSKFCVKCINSDICLECADKEGIHMQNGDCRCSADGYKEYLNSTDNKLYCITCHPLCSECNGPGGDECIECDSSKNAVLVSTNTCGCATHYFYDESEGNCIPCHTLCLNCVGPNADQCVGCDTNIALYVAGKQGLCVMECEDGYFKNGNTCESIFVSAYLKQSAIQVARHAQVTPRMTACYVLRQRKQCMKGLVGMSVRDITFLQTIFATVLLTILIIQQSATNRVKIVQQAQRQDVQAVDQELCFGKASALVHALMELSWKATIARVAFHPVQPAPLPSIALAACLLFTGFRILPSVCQNPNARRVHILTKSRAFVKTATTPA
eukprot:TRINITY_DN1609_c0_g3_i1.p1 TRINITY_DN1609_c0_g3~~TRINITY_DN1609_c0_g3_i1.p1  ORF type:complete len:863 (+),score=15.08 TRINITY_DN1609_c0_g3_i1:144-2591(+)